MLGASFGSPEQGSPVQGFPKPPLDSFRVCLFARKLLLLSLVTSSPLTRERPTDFVAFGTAQRCRVRMTDAGTVLKRLGVENTWPKEGSWGLGVLQASGLSAQLHSPPGARFQGYLYVYVQTEAHMQNRQKIGRQVNVLCRCNNAVKSGHHWPCQACKHHKLRHAGIIWSVRKLREGFVSPVCTSTFALNHQGLTFACKGPCVLYTCFVRNPNPQSRNEHME